MLSSLRPCAFLLTLLLLCSCASTPTPADLESLVQVFNVHQTGAEALPREVEGCEYLGNVLASAPVLENQSVSFSNPRALLETIRSRAHKKGADTAFVSLSGRLSQDRSLRAAIFRCGDSTRPQAVGSPVR